MPRARDTPDFVWDLLALGRTPHVAQNEPGRRSALEGRTARHPGFHQTHCRRKPNEETVTWIKTVGGDDKMRYLYWAHNKL